MSMFRTFLDELRHQLAADTEDPLIRAIRRYAATGSIIAAIISIALVARVIAGALPWALAPGSTLMLIGGVYGARSFFEDYVPESRRHGKWAAIFSATGLAAHFIGLALT